MQNNLCEYTINVVREIKKKILKKKIIEHQLQKKKSQQINLQLDLNHTDTHLQIGLRKLCR